MNKLALLSCLICLKVYCLDDEDVCNWSLYRLDAVTDLNAQLGASGLQDAAQVSARVLGEAVQLGALRGRVELIRRGALQFVRQALQQRAASRPQVNHGGGSFVRFQAASAQVRVLHVLVQYAHLLTRNRKQRHNLAQHVVDGGRRSTSKEFLSSSGGSWRKMKSSGSHYKRATSRRSSRSV